MPVTERFVTEQALARTYDSGYHSDAWAIVEQYRKATAYANRHNCKSGATASALDLPRGRLRVWIDNDGAPDPVRAIDTARTRGWLDVGYDEPQFAGLNALVANVFSGGSIAESTYAPSFAINDRGEDAHVFDALASAGVEYRIEADREGRADEARPTTDGTVLGRVLSVLGAPIGEKANQRLTLPTYLDGASDNVRGVFVYAYLENRAVEHDGKDTLTITEARNRSYLRSLAELLEGVAGERVTIGDRAITISADAARNLGAVRL